MRQRVTELPAGYRQYLTIDLQKDKKTALKVNLWGAAIGVVLLVIGWLAVTPASLFDMQGGLGAYVLRFAVIMAGLLAYVVLHELTHAAVMKHYGSEKVRFGFTGMYAYAGSEADYFGKKPYAVIALAPLAVWTLILTPVCFLVPQDWFWVVWLIEITHLSGCIGDIYVTLRLRCEPEDIYVMDTGVKMTVFGKK